MTEPAKNIEKYYPDREEAYKLWEEGIQHRLSKEYGFPFEHEYRFHTQGVAKAAEKIALYVTGMDSEKAFILGLLHDYGKRIGEKIEGRFHGQEGYERMCELGYYDVAKVCLTHTFPDKNFSDDEFSYPKEWKVWSKQILNNLEYDDYDYLIALCDKFFEGMSMVSIEKRIAGIVKRYNLKETQRMLLYKQSNKLKEYFDKKTGCDIYKILGIEE